jgi:hypothetical protein
MPVGDPAHSDHARSVRGAEAAVNRDDGRI